MTIDIYPTLSRIIDTEVGPAHEPIVAATVLEDIPGWDSVSAACVILALESEYDLVFGRDAVDGVTTAGDLVQLCLKAIRLSAG